MKRKYFSVMLMAAMTVASTSMVTSCKDYDDDINALRTEITNNATTLTSLVNEKVNNLTTELNTLKSQQTTLEQALKDAQSTLDAAIKKAETDSKAYADVQAAAAQKAAIEAAQANLDKAIDAVNASIDAANKRVDEVNSKVTTNAEAIAKLLDADKELQNAINEVKAEAAQAAKDALDAAQAAQKTADENATKLSQVADNLTKVQSDLEKAISVLGEKVDANTTAIAANLASANAQFEKVNSLIQANQKAIEDLKGADAELLKKIEANTTELTKLATELAQAKIDCAANLDIAKKYTDTEVEALKVQLGADIAAAKADAAANLAAAVANQDLINNGTNKDNEIWKAIQKNASDLTAAIASINTQISSLKTELSGDINANTVKISELQNLATGLQSQITANKNDITAIKNSLNDYLKTADFTTAKTAIEKEIADLKNKIGQIDDPDGTYTESLQTQIDNLEQTKASLSDFNTLKTAYDNLTDGYDGTLAELNTAVTKNATAIATNLKTLQDQIDVLAGFAKQLKSLVFSPTEYYQGIEAIGINSFNYTGITGLQTYDEDKDQVKEEDDSRKVNGGKISVVPDATAEYILNPSNASVDTDVKHYKFIVNNASYTRAAKASDLEITNVENKDGRALVTFKMKNADIAVIPTTGDGYVDVAALQYTYTSESKNDTTVTSDFAALKQYVNKNFIINKVAVEGQTEESNELHLATTASAAINTDAAGNYTAPTLEIEYDNEKGINLDKWINVHYTKNNSADICWGGQETVNKKKFKLAYSLLGYIAKGNDTNESGHAKINGSILTVNGYKGATGRQIIGRTPLVRVTLVDENSNEAIASVGYIVVKIVDKPVTPVQVADIAPIESDYTVACEGNILDGAQAITWEEVENKVLGTLNVSKEEFEANWKFEVKSEKDEKDETAKQYELQNGEFKLATDFGSVIATKDDNLGHQTNVLKWTVDNATAYDYFVTKRNTSKSIWVKFAPTKTTDKPVYVKLTWTPSAINKTPEATILNSAEHKKVAAWHEANSNNQGWDQLHIQVGNATEPNIPCEYQNLVIANTFSKSVLEIVQNDIKATYPALANKAHVSFVFAPYAEQTHKSYVGVSGANYDVVVDGTTISAKNKTTNVTSELAKIESEDGKVTIADNAATKDILNKYADINDLANALTFTVKAEVETCEPAKNLITLKNNKFDVKVIKPIFVESAIINSMQLNNYKSLTNVPVTFEFTDFNRYTQDKFYENSKNRVKFFDYYGITAIEQDGTIQTNYSGKMTDIDTNDIEVTFTKQNALKVGSYYISGVVKNMGTVTLKQVNQSRANGFQVLIPIKVTYKWGTLKTEIVLNVKAADAATAKRH